MVSQPPTYCVFSLRLSERWLIYFAVWHYGLTSDQKSRLKRIQYRTRLIVTKSPRVPYYSLSKQISLATLSVRRDELCFKFVVGVLANPQLRELFATEHIFAPTAPATSS